MTEHLTASAEITIPPPAARHYGRFALAGRIDSDDLAFAVTENSLTPVPDEQDCALDYARGYLAALGFPESYLEVVGKEGALEMFHYGMSGLPVPETRLLEMVCGEAEPWY